MKKIIESVLAWSCLILGVICFIIAYLLGLKPWVNTTDQEIAAQKARISAAMETACADADGQWINTGTSNFCTASYQQPDFSWYVKPIATPFGSIQKVLVVAGCISIFVPMEDFIATAFKKRRE